MLEEADDRPTAAKTPITAVLLQSEPPRSEGPLRPLARRAAADELPRFLRLLPLLAATAILIRESERKMI